MKNYVGKNKDRCIFLTRYFVLSWQRLRHTALNARLTKPWNDERLFLLLGHPSNRKEPGDHMVRSVCLFDEVHCDAPPCAERTEHPEVARSLDALCDASLKPVLRWGSFRSGCSAAVVCEEAACDRRADCEREETYGEDEVSGCRCECAAPGECSKHDEPGCKFGEVGVDGMCLNGSSSLYLASVCHSRGKCVTSPTTNAYRIPIAIQKLPHIVFMTVTRVSRALNPYSPAMNCAKPPNMPTC